MTMSALSQKTPFILGLPNVYRSKNNAITADPPAVYAGMRTYWDSFCKPMASLYMFVFTVLEINALTAGVNRAVDASNTINDKNAKTPKTIPTAGMSRIVGGPSSTSMYMRTSVLPAAPKTDTADPPASPQMEMSRSVSSSFICGLLVIRITNFSLFGVFSENLWADQRFLEHPGA